MFCLPIPPNSRISTFRWKVMLLFSADAEFIFVHEMNAYYTLTQHSCNRKLETGTYCHWNWMVNSSGTCQLYWWIDKIYWNVRASILSVLGRTFVIVVSMGICLWNIYFILHVAQTARCEFIWWLVSFDAVAGGEALTPSTVYSVTSTFAFITNTPYLQMINFFSVEMEVVPKLSTTFQVFTRYCQTFISLSFLLLPIEIRDRGGVLSIRHQYFYSHFIWRIDFLSSFLPFNKRYSLRVFQRTSNRLKRMNFHCSATAIRLYDFYSPHSVPSETLSFSNKRKCETLFAV